MKNFSFLGCVINIILFVVYVFVTMLVVGIIYGALSGGYTEPAVFDKIGYLVIFVVLVVTAILRKFFYKTVWLETDEVTIVPKVKDVEKPKKKATKKDDGKMKIYVDKEIK